MTSAGGLEAYETTIGRVPWLPAAPEKRAVYASSHPSTTSTPFARSLRQKSCQPSPNRAMVASMNARPGVDVAGFSTTSSLR